MNGPATVGRIVILGSGITALAVVRAARHLGLRPLLFDTAAGIAVASKHARAEIHAGPDALALARLMALGREQPSLLISTTDDWLRVLLQYRAELAAVYAHILHPGNAALAVCLDKEKFAAWCESQALRAPWRYRLGELVRLPVRELPRPLLVRPAETRHAAAPHAVMKAVEVKSRAALLGHVDALAREGLRPVLTESLLGRPLRQYSVGFARRGDAMLTVVARKLRPLPAACAPGTLVETVDAPELDALARQVAERLDYQGIGEIEILRDTATGESFLIEVNARPWLQFGLGAATGRDLLRFAIQGRGAAGRLPRTSACWLDWRGDLRACFKPSTGLVCTGQLGLLAYCSSLLRANLFASWSWLDQGPFWRGLRDMVSHRVHPAAPDPGTIPAGGSAAANH